VYVQSPDEDNERLLLNVEFHGGTPLEITVPEEEGTGSSAPTVEIWIPLTTLDLRSLVGQTIPVPVSQKDNEDGKWNRLHVYESTDLRNVFVTFVTVTETDCRLILTAATQDPNHYDGSKPDAAIQLDACFPLEEILKKAWVTAKVR
jgi:hypothetical protein